MQLQRSHKEPHEYSQSLPAIKQRLFRERETPEEKRARLNKHYAYKKAKMVADPEFRAKHCARNNRRLKERRASADTWPRHILNSVRARALREGVLFRLEISDVRLPPLCPVFGTEWVFGSVCHPYQPTVDRLRPEIGYVPGNVCVISRRANQMKSDGTCAELEAVLKYMRDKELP